MLKAKPDKLSVKDSLLVPGPAQAALPTGPGDPPVAQIIQVDVDQIDLCELNPRRSPNTIFQRLYESILVNGLDNPIHITRLPGSTRYSVSAGGNTRLAVFRKLRDDTRDPRFQKIPCIFKPYVSESEVLKAHLRENDLREGLVFIDEAQAILNLKQLLEQEAGGQPLSDAAFERTLRDIGHFRSRRDIGRMRWAVETLYPALPIAFERGLGPRKVDELGKLLGTYQNFCVDRVGALVREGRLSSIPVFGDVAQATDMDARQLDEWVGAAFRPLFTDVLAAHDDASFAEVNVEAFRHSLDGRIGEIFGLAFAELRRQVDALMAVTVAKRSTTAGASAVVAPTPSAVEATPSVPAQTPDTSEPESSLVDANGAAALLSPIKPPVDENSPELNPFTSSGPATPTTAIQANPVVSHATLHEPLAWTEADSETVVDASVSEARPAVDESVTDQNAPRPPEPSAVMPESRSSSTGPVATVLAFPSESRHAKPGPQPGDVDALRERIQALATRVAHAARIQHLVQPDPDTPTGFSLTGLPADATSRETALWWLLSSLSCGPGFDHVPPAQHVFVYDPAAFAHHFLFAFDNGQPPAEALLRDLFALIQSIVALAWAGQGTTDTA